MNTVRKKFVERRAGEVKTYRVLPGGRTKLSGAATVAKAKSKDIIGAQQVDEKEENLSEDEENS